MASSKNKVNLLGRLGADPDVSTISNGTKMAKVNLATSERYQDKQTGEWKEKTEWHRLVFWGALAEMAEKWLKKGSLIDVEGKISYGEYTAQDGTKRYTTDIVVREMVMCGHKGEGNVEGVSSSYNAPASQANAAPSAVLEQLSKSITPDAEFDDIPF